MKFLVVDPGSLEQRLREAGFAEKTPPTHEMNTLYDLPDKSLRHKGHVLRLRKYGDRWTLTHKALN
ncbi:MAG TPA: hypothetical protein VN428_09900 [Bryobacteraceae bacterium]|nr:hypothetical protein [Bryobacteraceae bacterium]